MEAAQSIILDLGTSSVRCGFSGEDLPRSIFPSKLPKEKEGREVMKLLGRMEGIDGGVESVDVGGKEVGLGEVMERGEIKNWDLLTPLLEHTFTTHLDLSTESLSHPILISEPPLADKDSREKLTEIMFEVFKVQGVCFCNSSVLSLFASGRTRGMVVECGSGKTHAVPIFEGFSLPHAILNLPAAGQDVTEYLQKNIKDKLGYNVVKDMKHSLANCLPVTGPNALLSKVEYSLPDGTPISIDGVYTSSCCDLLFNPDDYGIDNVDGGIGEMVGKCMGMVDKDVRLDMERNVVVAGGTTMIDGFTERLKEEILKSEGMEDCAQLNVIPDKTGREPGYNSQRKHAAWIGGSIMASLDTFSSIQITKQDYEDSGANGEYKKLVHRKAVM
ncbi:hypothetical protein TrLO_g13368 [Triparma laevis f. longispina]|uniref:Actin n=1 Tax=Triparma laevis f. longispina TaxID=1714387 RepID=A0A9W7KUR6_9STRA|nr:hypothetical protein TrLO_g13368 [Triparma laevis f. longispina]